MSGTSDILFAYLRDILYNPGKAVIDIDSLDSDYVMLGKGLMYFAQCFSQYNELAIALAKGDLSAPMPPPENELAAPLKTLHASLRHLTWQSQQVAKGDYKQRVDFMGDFADAFNKMVEQLAERQQKLEDEIEFSKKKTNALEQSNRLFGNITRHIPQQIFVVDPAHGKVLFMNDSARRESEADSNYQGVLLGALRENRIAHGGNAELQYKQGSVMRYLSISTYSIEWDTINAEALVISDISEEKNQIKELETRAYRDSMTNLYNRFFGMQLLNQWLDEKQSFALIFIDLDNLKCINDKLGHGEGDNYIIATARYLTGFSGDAVACRIGGDEFMLLVPGITESEAHNRIMEISDKIQEAGVRKGKEFLYSISFGIVYIGSDNAMISSDILSLADERMYEYKRARKKNRQSNGVLM